ncbi:MAG: phosphotriesterase-related protein [Desulfobacteraceae bacterium 4572_89]|nr:MAG: phosphotriesterase-related protein [Desulfobacteraceae bacterium 4572_89]
MEKTMVNTVTGPVSSDELGTTLMHEHLLFGYPGWEGDQTIAPFDSKAAVSQGVDVLNQLKVLGLTTYVDATTNDSGRCPEVYKEVSEKTGINIICSTGYYFEGEGSSAYWKFRGSLGDISQEIYDLFMAEITTGIRDTGIKAGVIKVGSSKGVITDYEKMMFTAAARVQKDTGVPIITHTQEGTMGPEQAKLLISEGVDPAKIQIGHMSDSLDINYQLETLEHGVYVSWDRMGLQGLVGCPMDEQRYAVIIDLIKKGFADKLMLSHDYIIQWLGRPLNLPEEAFPLIANWHPTHLFNNIIPALKQGGVTDEQIETIIKGNPGRIFSAV